MVTIKIPSYRVSSQNWEPTLASRMKLIWYWVSYWGAFLASFPFCGDGYLIFDLSFAFFFSLSLFFLIIVFDSCVFRLEEVFPEWTHCAISTPAPPFAYLHKIFCKHLFIDVLYTFYSLCLFLVLTTFFNSRWKGEKVEEIGPLKPGEGRAFSLTLHIRLGGMLSVTRKEDWKFSLFQATGGS